MSKARKLTPAEKDQLHDLYLPIEEANYPGHSVHVTVEDELDENGQAHYRTLATKMTAIKDWPDA